MTNQLALWVARRAKCTDYCWFLVDRVAGSHGKYKRNNSNDDIKKYGKHSIIALYIISGKDNRLIYILWYKAFDTVQIQKRIYIQSFQERFAECLCLFLICRTLAVTPWIIVVKMIIVDFIKSILCHNSHTKSHSVKHHIWRGWKQCTVIRKCH